MATAAAAAEVSSAPIQQMA